MQEGKGGWRGKEGRKKNISLAQPTFFWPLFLFVYCVCRFFTCQSKQNKKKAKQTISNWRLCRWRTFLPGLLCHSKRPNKHFCKGTTKNSHRWRSYYQTMLSFLLFLFFSCCACSLSSYQVRWDGWMSWIFCPRSRSRRNQTQWFPPLPFVPSWSLYTSGDTTSPERVPYATTRYFFPSSKTCTLPNVQSNIPGP